MRQGPGQQPDPEPELTRSLEDVGRWGARWGAGGDPAAEASEIRRRGDRLRRRRRTATGLGLAAVTVAAATVAGGHGLFTGDAAVTPVATPPPSVAPGPTPTTTGRSVPVDPAWLLAAEDFGDGDQPPPVPRPDAVPRACTLDLSARVAGASSAEKAGWEFPDGVVAQSVQGYRDAGGAQAAYSEIARAMDTCTDRPPEGHPITLTSRDVISAEEPFTEGFEVRWTAACLGCVADRAEAVALVGAYVVHVRWQTTGVATRPGSAERLLLITLDRMRADLSAGDRSGG